MNNSEPLRDLQNTSDDLSSLQQSSKRVEGIGRGQKYAGAEIPDDEFSKENYSLVMEEAYAEFGYFCPTPRKGGIGCKHVLSLRERHSLSG